MKDFSQKLPQEYYEGARSFPHLFVSILYGFRHTTFCCHRNHFLRMDFTEFMREISVDFCVRKLSVHQTEIVLTTIQLYAYCMNFLAVDASNDAHMRSVKRERTVPIPESIIHVPGYPEKLAIFRMQASKFWQVRCWHNGRSFRKSTKSQSKRSALIFARIFYEQLMASNAMQDTSLFVTNKSTDKPTNARTTFGALSAKMYTNETARVKRGEFSRGSLQVLRNRLDAHLLPRWGAININEIDYAQLLKFTQELSEKFSTITINQYLVIIKKVFTLASALNMLQKMPAFPKIKVKTTPRGSFTPNEYWNIIRTARKLVGKLHPEYSDLRRHYKLRNSDNTMPIDLQWAIRFMVNSFIRPEGVQDFV